VDNTCHDRTQVDSGLTIRQPCGRATGVRPDQLISTWQARLPPLDAQRLEVGEHDVDRTTGQS
jgi:hypothetical protein